MTPSPSVDLAHLLSPLRGWEGVSLLQCHALSVRRILRQGRGRCTEEPVADHEV